MATFNFTPNDNILVNILNRRNETEVVETMQRLSTFDNFIRTNEQLGDTIEQITSTIAEKINFDVTRSISGRWTPPKLNKFYQDVNYEKVYLKSVDRNNVNKAMQTVTSASNLVNQIENATNKSYDYDLYYGFRDLLQNSMNIPAVLVEDLSDIKELSTDERNALIENVIQTILETAQDMRFYSNRYIKVDETLTPDAQGRLIATSAISGMTLFINKTYSTWLEIMLADRFNTMGINLNEIFDVRVVDFSDTRRVAYLVHNARIGYVPRVHLAQTTLPFTTTRQDFSLVVQGTFYDSFLFPSVMFVTNIIETDFEPTDKGTRFENQEPTIVE